MNNLTDDKRMLVYGPKSSHTDIFCFSTTRHGGCSEGDYASFNCNHYCGDVPDKGLCIPGCWLYLIKHTIRW